MVKTLQVIICFRDAPFSAYIMAWIRDSIQPTLMEPFQSTRRFLRWSSKALDILLGVQKLGHTRTWSSEALSVWCFFLCIGFIYSFSHVCSSIYKILPKVSRGGESSSWGESVGNRHWGRWDVLLDQGRTLPQICSASLAPGFERLLIAATWLSLLAPQAVLASLGDEEQEEWEEEASISPDLPQPNGLWLPNDF